MRKITQRAEDAYRLGVPLIFSEFGACLDNQACNAEINNSLDAFDSQMVSWAYWMYKGFHDFTTTGGDDQGLFRSDGSIQDSKVKALTRTYVQAFQGTGLKTQFDKDTGFFTT